MVALTEQRVGSLDGQAVEELDSKRWKRVATRPDGAQTTTDCEILDFDFDE